MNNFSYHNPTKIVFGRGSIAELKNLLGLKTKIMLLYGSGSIKKNGVYSQVKSALSGNLVIEFGGIEPNPRYETCMKGVELAKEAGVDFLLAVGGGSVLDGTKFIAAASPYHGEDPWDILAKGASVTQAVPLGSVLTLPATGSEMNSFSVISRESTKEKLPFSSDLVRPRFSILDPETTFSLPPRQTANGIVDAFVHVVEQYVTYPANGPLQDRQAEAILCTLVEEGPKVMKNPKDYETRSTIMWCATQALNGLIGLGVPQDWSTHYIGHELTALYGIDHGQSLALVLPGVWEIMKKPKQAKLLQYADKVWGIDKGSAAQRMDKAIDHTEKFFRSLGIKTKLSEYGIPKEARRLVSERISKRGILLGEHRSIGAKEIERILKLRH